MLEAPWVGKTPEEYHEMVTGEKEYTVYFSMKGSICIMANSREEAEEKVLSEFSNRELLDYVDETVVDDID
jgi:hypothetical protein